MTASPHHTAIDWSGQLDQHKGRIDVVAILVTPDGRYLMQQRDDIPGIFFPGYWGGFGGGVEAGETAEQAVIREMQEELGFTPKNPKRFTELAMPMGDLKVPLMVKVFFEIEVSETDIETMVQGEGAGKKLFTMESLLQEPKIVPWDVWGMMLHSRKETVLRRKMAP